jgi:amidophosphoribosyltransferase
MRTSKCLLESRKQTSNTAAAVLAKYLDKPFSNAFVKNRYVYRTFILPGQAARQRSVRRKLSPIESEFKGKVVCIVDDSIVRGTTSREIVCNVFTTAAKVSRVRTKTGLPG